MESPYLLSGMGMCSECGGALLAMTGAHGKSRACFYGCSYNHKRGTSVCRNSFQIEQQILDQAILSVISNILDQRAVELAVEEALERLRSGQVSQLDRQASVERELSLIETRMRNLTEAIANGNPPEFLVGQLRDEEIRKKTLIGDLENLVNRGQVASLDRTRLKRQLVAKATDLRGLLSRRVAQARQVIRKLVVGRLTFTPFEEGGRKGHRFRGEGTYGRLLAGDTFSTSVPTTRLGGSNGIRTRVSALRGPTRRLTRTR